MLIRLIKAAVGGLTVLLTKPMTASLKLQQNAGNKKIGKKQDDLFQSCPTANLESLINTTTNGNYWHLQLNVCYK